MNRKNPIQTFLRTKKQDRQSINVPQYVETIVFAPQDPRAGDGESGIYGTASGNVLGAYFNIHPFEFFVGHHRFY